jgi:hypothetical protein
LTGRPGRIILPPFGFATGGQSEGFMRKVTTLTLAASFLLAAFGVATVPAAAADYIGTAPGHVARYAHSGICAEGGYLSRISHKFRYQITHVPYLPDVEIVDFQGVHENRYLPADEDHPIARRYCEATAVLSNGRRHQVFYLIESGMGFAGIGGTNVEFCVNGFDRWKVYDGRCRVLW